MKPIIIETSIKLITTIEYEAQLTEAVYNALLHKYKVEIPEEDQDYYTLPSFEEYYNGLLNPNIVYAKAPYEPHVCWHFYYGENFVSGHSEYYSGDWIEGYTREAGMYHSRGSLREVIQDMVKREYHLFCHQRGYPVDDQEEYSFLPDEECVIPFEVMHQIQESEMGRRTEVDIPTKTEIRYYE